MTREEAIRLLQENMDTIRSFGVRRIGLFGSVVRGELSDASDIDVVVEFEKGWANMRNVVGLVKFLEGLFGRKIDLMTAETIDYITNYHVRNSIKNEVNYVEAR
jgi:hypothetical protein